jgi:phage I-like protein
MKNRIALSIEILADAAGEPPKEFKLFKGGFVETTKGTFQFSERSCAEVMSKAADWGNDFPVDYDHASLMSMFSADPAEAGKAAGWFKPEIRSGELWATSVTWTPKAAAMLKAREYRYCSPAFDSEDDGTITELVNCAITNLPATKRMDPLMASRAGEPGNPKEPKMKVLLSKLGLSESASEAEAIAKLEALQAFHGQVFALTGKTSVAESLGVLNAWRTNEAEVVRLGKAIAELEAKGADREIEDAIGKGKTDGKITPAMEPELRKLAKEHGVKALTAFLSVAAAAPKPHEEPAGDGGAAGLTAAELDACKKFGRKPEEFAALKKQSIAAGTWPFAN